MREAFSQSSNITSSSLFFACRLHSFFSLVRFVCLEAFRIAINRTFRAPSPICQVGCVHLDGSEGREHETFRRSKCMYDVPGRIYPLRSPGNEQAAGKLVH
jgi:hypothetical protein